MPIPNAIKRAREAAGLTQVQLAARMKVAKSTVAGWELGTHDVRRKRLPVLARVLRIDIAELLR